MREARRVHPRQARGQRPFRRALRHSRSPCRWRSRPHARHSGCLVHARGGGGGGCAEFCRGAARRQHARFFCACPAGRVAATRNPHAGRPDNSKGSCKAHHGYDRGRGRTAAWGYVPAALGSSPWARACNREHALHGGEPHSAAALAQGRRRRPRWVPEPRGGAKSDDPIDGTGVGTRRIEEWSTAKIVRASTLHAKSPRSDEQRPENRRGLCRCGAHCRRHAGGKNPIGQRTPARAARARTLRTSPARHAAWPQTGQDARVWNRKNADSRARGNRAWAALVRLGGRSGQATRRCRARSTTSRSSTASRQCPEARLNARTGCRSGARSDSERCAVAPIRSAR